MPITLLGGFPMKVFGYTLWFFILIFGMVVAQYIFHRKTGRTFWRALLPYEIRMRVAPNDRVRLDPFMVLEEWTAILLLGAYLTLPLIVLDYIGFIDVFH